MSQPPAATPEPSTPAAPVVTTPVVAPVAGPGSTSAGSPAPRRSRLPWYLVALLSLLCLALTMALGWRTNQVTALRAERDRLQQAQGQQATAAPSQGVPKTPAAPASTISPRPTTGPQAEQLLKLQRRDPADQLAKGKADAPVVMIEWADYRCPFCAKFALQTRPALQPYIDSGSLRVEFRDLVLFGDESRLAAIAARAAGRQGRYFEFADALWRLHSGQGHPTVSAKEVAAAATQAGVPDLDRFTQDLQDPALAQAVDKDVAEASSLGLNSTPFFLVNTTPVSGALPVDQFVALLEASGATK